MAERSAEEIAEKRRWAEALPELYLARGRMETPAMFHERIVRRMHFPFDFKWMLGVLLNRKALGRRKRVFRSRGAFTLPGQPSPSSAA